jgi:RimJ/RimL family protein N-acetyltransferase
VERRNLPPILHTLRLQYRRADPVDAAASTAIRTDPARFRLYFPMLDPEIPTASLPDAFAGEAARLWESSEEYAYALYDSASSAFVGHASVHAVAWKHGCAELAYWVAQEAEGKGYASAAVHGLEAMLFELGFHRLEIRCDVQNQASRKVAERCGYRLEGTLREHMQRRDGSYRNSHVFGLLAHERAERGSWK